MLCFDWMDYISQFNEKWVNMVNRNQLYFSKSFDKYYLIKKSQLYNGLFIFYLTNFLA
jgi:hypothetical protein